MAGDLSRDSGRATSEPRRPRRIDAGIEVDDSRAGYRAGDPIRRAYVTDADGEEVLQ